MVRNCRLALVGAVLVGCGGSSMGDDGGWDVPLETWSWVDVPGMVCGNGSPTGIAINPTKKSDKLLILFEGGGACWEAAACYGIIIPVAAVHLDGFNAQTFASDDRPTLDASWLLQRNDPTSPFGDASWVFVPYCTGDLHAGTRDMVYDALGQQKTMHHRGGDNVDAMLARIAGYPHSEVFALGISAGGFGVELNWDRIAATFPDVTTHAFADGSQVVPILNGYGTMQQSWNMRFPTGCTDCADRFDNLGAFWQASPPATGGRLGLIASLQDSVLRTYFGYDAAGMKTASLAVGNAMSGSLAAFMVDTDAHTRLGAPTTMTSTGVVLQSWVEAWASGGSTFTTVGP